MVSFKSLFRVFSSTAMPKDSTPPIFAAERQEKIAALVASRGRIHLDELASLFEVSQATLRKDLTILDTPRPSEANTWRSAQHSRAS